MAKQLIYRVEVTQLYCLSQKIEIQQTYKNNRVLKVSVYLYACNPLMRAE